MHRPFRFGVVVASAQSRAAWITTALRAEELGYAILLMPDRTTGGLLAPMPALALAASATQKLRVGSEAVNRLARPIADDLSKREWL